MIKINLAILICFTLCCVKDLAMGQTAVKLHQQFGKPENVFTISENIGMTAKYGSDSQVCQMSFFPRHVSPSTVYLSPKLSLEQLAPIIEKIVPQSVRGKVGIGGYTLLGGGSATTIYNYENIMITLHSPFVVPPPEKQEKIATPVSNQPSERSQTVEINLQVKDRQIIDSNKIFYGLFSGSAEVINVYWKKRKCTSTKKAT